MSMAASPPGGSRQRHPRSGCKLGGSKPIVVRFDGNAAAEGLHILASAINPNIHVSRLMEGAAANAAQLRRWYDPVQGGSPMLFIEDGAPRYRPGHDRPSGHDPYGSNAQGRHQYRRRREPAQGRHIRHLPGAKNGADANIPVFATCGEAREATGAKASVVFVPPKFAKSAVVEAVEAGIELIVVITEGIPVADSAYFVELALKKGVRIIGPNCPGPSSRSATLASIRHHPRRHRRTRPARTGLQIGTPHLPAHGRIVDIGFTVSRRRRRPIVGTTLLETLRHSESDPTPRLSMMIRRNRRLPNRTPPHGPKGT